MKPEVLLRRVLVHKIANCDSIVMVIADRRMSSGRSSKKWRIIVLTLFNRRYGDNKLLVLNRNCTLRHCIKSFQTQQVHISGIMHASF